MAVSANVIWEIRTTGSNSNGGGFNSTATGTDFSQQATAAYTFTDLATVTGTGANPVVTSASHNFTASDVGNIMRISSGALWLVGWYEIVGASGVNATLDRACASNATASSGTYAVGGALTFANTTADAGWSATVRPGNTIYIGTGNYTASSISLTASTVNAPLTVVGYNASRTDAPTGTSRPSILFSGGNNITLGAYNHLRHVQMSSAATNRTILAGTQTLIRNCKVVNNYTASGATAITGSGNNTIFDCELICYRGSAYSASSQFHMQGCYVHDSDVGITVNTGSYQMIVMDTIFESCVAKTIDMQTANSAKQVISNCTFFGGLNTRAAVGVAMVSGVGAVSFVNNIVSGYTAGVTHADTLHMNYDDYNCYFNNSANSTNWTLGNGSTTANAGFASVGQIVGTSGSTSGTVLTDTNQTFTSVVPNRDFVYLRSGSGVVAGQYMITAASTNSISLDIAPGTNVTADKVYQITTGRNFAINGGSVKGRGFPGTFQASLTIGGMSPGAAQSAGGGQIRQGWPKRFG